MINRQMSACPEPIVTDGVSGFLHFKTAEDGAVHGLRVGDRVRVKRAWYGMDDPYPLVQVTQIEVVREDVGFGWGTYARFYVNTVVKGQMTPTLMSRVVGVDDLADEPQVQPERGTHTML